MYSWNDLTTILENKTGAFFNPKGIFLYANDPNSHTKVVLCWSSFAMGTWLYPENPSVNEKHSWNTSTRVCECTLMIGQSTT